MCERASVDVNGACETEEGLTFGVKFLRQARYQSLEQLQGGLSKCKGFCNSWRVHHGVGLYTAGVASCFCICVGRVQEFTLIVS
jgi:hypothetical protein